MTENANYVTRAELKAHLDPMREDIKAVGVDVKVLLLRSASTRAVGAVGWRTVSILSTLCAGILAGLLFH